MSTPYLHSLCIQPQDQDEASHCTSHTLETPDAQGKITHLAAREGRVPLTMLRVIDPPAR